MSKNFDAIQQALGEAWPEIPSKVVVGSEADSKAHSTSSDFDAAAQQECYKLVQRIFLGQSANPFHAVVFAGVDRGVGCSRICVEAARILAANTRSSVCLIDANFRVPSLPAFLRVPNDRGLANCLREEGSIRSFAQQLNPPNLWLLASGEIGPDSTSPLNSDRLKPRMQELRKEFDYILIDAPALNLYTDAIALGRSADGVVVVLQADSTRRESALKGLQGLREAHIEVLGAVLNRRTFPIPESVYRRV
jgi:capsular exopolysaccharide synthesis family protein